MEVMDIWICFFPFFLLLEIFSRSRKSNIISKNIVWETEPLKFAASKTRLYMCYVYARPIRRVAMTAMAAAQQTRQWVLE